MKQIFTTRQLALKTAGDYRVLLTSVSQSGSISGSDGDVILDVMNQRIVKYTAVDVLQFPLEEDVVYFDQSATSNQLLMWTGTEVAAIGSVTAIAGVTVDAWNTGTYVIATDITTTLAPANNSTLIFEGGVLGNHINRYGKPYIIGTKTIGAAGQSLEYDTLQSLPSNASVGAIGVVANTYHVVKTTQGWIVQNLAGTFTQIQSIMSTIGTFSVGQTALATDRNKLICRNGNNWIDALGNMIS